MASLETLEQRLNDNEKLSTTEHKIIIEKIEHIEQRFSEKIIVLEKSSDEFQVWKSYSIAVVAIITFAVPLALYILF
jgi:hypothetical protein